MDIHIHGKKARLMTNPSHQRPQTIVLLPFTISTTNDDASNANLDAMYEELEQLPSEEPIDPVLKMVEQIYAGRRYGFSKLESFERVLSSLTWLLDGRRKSFTLG